MEQPYKIYPLGDSAITIHLGDAINLDTHKKVRSLFKALEPAPFAGLIDIIPAYASITLVYDVLLTKKNCPPTKSVFQYVENYLHHHLEQLTQIEDTNNRQVIIPVCYHPSLGLDLQTFANEHSLTPEEVIAIHTATTYNVYMIGFLPGFPYMATVDDRIATPRKSEPRKIVPAGSVGIAGNQTGIYPFASPGGWQLIGQTPLKIFDAESKQPAMLQPGDEVRFVPISLHEFNQLQQP